MSKILIAEDDAGSRHMLEELLALKDHHVIAAENGEDALKLARQDPPDVIISDIMMPVMNGFRLCWKVKNDAGLRNIPFIFYTAAFLDKDDEKLAMSLGASRFIVKPAEWEQFIRILDEVLEEHRQGILQVPKRPPEADDALLEMYDHSIARKLTATVEKLQNEQKLLLKSKQRLNEAQEIAHIGHWEFDVKSNSLKWSDEIYRILGYKPQEFKVSYKVFIAAVHPDDRASVAKVHRESFAKKTRFDIEFRVLLKDGTIKYLNEKSQTICDDDGQPAHLMGTVQDITGRRQAEENLRHERDLMARIMETSPVGITVVNSEGQITFANPTAEKVLGLSPEEVTGRTYNSPEWRITDYDGKPLPDEQLPFRQVMDTGLPVYDVRHAIEWPNGRRVLLSINGAPLLDKTGKIEGMISTLRDVTEQIETAKALRESEEQYRALFEQSRDAISLTTPDGRHTHVNQEFLNLLGWTREEVKSLNAEQVYVNPGDRNRFRQQLEKDGSVRDFEVKLRKKDGTQMDCLMTSSIQKTKEGGVFGYQSIIRDITERKLAESKIKDYADNLEAMVEERTRELNRALYDTEEARDRIDGILKSVGDGLIVTDLYNRVLLMNRAAEDLLGVRLSEVIDRPIDFAIEDKTLRERIMKTLSKKKGGYQFDFEKPGDDSSRPRIIRGRTSMIEDKTGEYVGIITIMQDVTHEREIDRTKTEFVSTAAHQLRTPLASIQGFSELLATRDNMTEEEKKECLSYIHAQSVNLANIINDLLDISRIESGIGFSLNKAPCSITELIRKTVPYFQLQSKKHRFDLILSDKPTEIMADIDKLRQVLENVLSNAVKYSPNGGVIRITSAAVEDHCRISISDEGIGMTPEQIEKVFDKFYRADASNTAISGTGLGMNIVKHLVEAHGGEVRVESKYKIGTTVTVTLPMQINKTE